MHINPDNLNHRVARALQWYRVKILNPSMSHLPITVRRVALALQRYGVNFESYDVTPPHNSDKIFQYLREKRCLYIYVQLSLKHVERYILAKIATWQFQINFNLFPWIMLITSSFTPASSIPFLFFSFFPCRNFCTVPQIITLTLWLLLLPSQPINEHFQIILNHKVSRMQTLNPEFNICSQGQVSVEQ